MAGSEYRDEQTAARARVAVLEEDLRKRKGLAAKMAALSAPHAAEKNSIRKRIETFRRMRYFGMASSVLVVVGFIGLMYAMSKTASIPATLAVYVGFALTVAWLRIAWSLRDRSIDELRDEQKLKKISSEDSREEKRYRVATEQLRVQAHLEPAEMEALEDEIAEARAMLDDEKKAPASEKT